MDAVDIKYIQIPLIQLRCSEWFKWKDVYKKVADGGIKVPNNIPSVYEAKYHDEIKKNN